jgi:hypothetical protein
MVFINSRSRWDIDEIASVGDESVEQGYNEPFFVQSMLFYILTFKV